MSTNFTQMSTNFTHKPGQLPGAAAGPASRGSPEGRAPARPGRLAEAATERRPS